MGVQSSPKQLEIIQNKVVENFVKKKLNENNKYRKIKSGINAQNLDNQITTEVKIAIQKSLAKLNNNDTKEIGLKEIHIIIERNTNKNCLRAYISCLTEKKEGLPISASELIILLFGFLASIYK